MVAKLKVKPSLGTFVREVPLEIPGRYCTVADLLDNVGFAQALHPYAIVQRDGEIIEDWDKIVDLQCDEIVVSLVPRGGGDGKNPIAMVAAIAVAVIAPQIGAAAYGAGTIGASVVTVGATMVGMMAVGALFPPPDQSLGDNSGADASQSFYLNGQSNQMTPYGIVPRLYGRHKMFPRIIGAPYLLPVGDVNYMTMLFDFGYGPLSIEDLRIDGTPLDNFTNFRYKIHELFDKNSTLDMYNQDVEIQALSLLLDPASGNSPETPMAKAAETVLLDFSFPQGLIRYNDLADELDQEVNLKIEAREVGGPAWLPLGNVIRQFIGHGDSNAFAPGEKLDITNGTVGGGDLTEAGTMHLPYIETVTGGGGVGQLKYLVLDGETNGTIPPGPNTTTQFLLSGWNPVDGMPGDKPGTTDHIIYNGVTHDITAVTEIDITATPLKHFLVTIATPIAGGIPVGTIIDIGIVVSNPTDEVHHYGYRQPFSQFEVEAATTALLTVGDSLKIEGRGYIVTNIAGNVITVDRPVEPLTTTNFTKQTFVPWYIEVSTTLTTVDTIKVTGRVTQPRNISLELEMLDKKTYEFRITNLTPADTDKSRSQVYWTGLRSLLDAPPIVPDVPHTLIELKIKASEQLQGTLQTFNAIATSLLPVFDGTNWNLSATRNPAWITADILCGNANGRPVDRSRLDTAKLMEWAKECDALVPVNETFETYFLDAGVNPSTTTATVVDAQSSQSAPVVGQAIYVGASEYVISAVVTTAIDTDYNRHALTFATMPAAMTIKGEYTQVRIGIAATTKSPRFTCDMVVDFKTTVRELLNIVTATGRATATMRDGKYSIVKESDAQSPVQMITNRNAAAIGSQMVYAEIPDALRVKYVDELTWDQEEIFVYTDPSADPNDAVLFEDLTLVGTTRRSQAVRLSNYYIREAKLRRETVTCSMDIENLVATRGQIVSLATDVLNVGGGSRRIVKVTGGNIEIDEPLTNPAVDTARVRKADGTIELVTVTYVDDYNYSLAKLVGEVGALVEFGTKSLSKSNYIIQAVQPGANLSANLTLVEHRPAIVNSDSGSIVARPTIPGLPPGYLTDAPSGLSLHVGKGASDSGAVSFYTQLSWNPPKLVTAAKYHVCRQINNGPITMIRTSPLPEYSEVIEPIWNDFGNKIEYSVIAVSNSGHNSPDAKINLVIQRGGTTTVPVAGLKVTLPTALAEPPQVIATIDHPASGDSYLITASDNTSFTIQLMNGGHAIHGKISWVAAGKGV